MIPEFKWKETFF